MKPSPNHIDREWVENRIESYTDGLLSRREKRVFEAMIGQDGDLAREVDLARRVRSALGELPTPACPPSAYEPVLELARRQSRREPASGLMSWLRGISLLRMTLAPVVATAAIVVVAALYMIMLGRRADQPAHSAAEVQAALEEVKLALSYVSLAGRETGHTIRIHAVDETLIGPIRRAIDQAEIGSTETRARDRAAGRTTRGES